MDFQLWNFSAPSDMFNSIQKTQLPSNVSSYFRRPSKVVKPSSRNNSPRMSTRRRMTTSGHMPIRTRSVVDYQRMSMPHLSDSNTTVSRPISWHPHMMDEMSQFYASHPAPTESVMATPYSTAEVNGLITPMSYPMMDEPQIQELITPLEGLSAHEQTSGYHYGQDYDMTQYWLSQQSKDAVNSLDPSMYDASGYGMWYGNGQYMMANLPNTPASPTYLPMPEFGAPLQVEVPEVEEDSEELVAMGLYDSPADVQSSSLLFGGAGGMSARKTLKLEDAFEPSANSEEDDEDDEEDDGTAEDDDDGDVNPAPAAPQTSTVANLPMEQYTQVMDHSHVTDQWPAPVPNQYGWI